MKKLLMLSVLAACELQPAPKQAPPPAPASAGSAAAAAVATPGDAGVVATGSAAAVAVDAGVRIVAPPPPAVQPTADCQKAAIRYAALFIEAAPPAQRGIFEQDRANTVRKTEIACTQQAWPPAALACIDQAKNDRDARACLVKFPPPGAPPPPGTGSNGKPYHPPRD